MYAQGGWPVIVGGTPRRSWSATNRPSVTPPLMAMPYSITVSGFTVDAVGVALTSATVKLYRTVDDVVIGQTISDSVTGAYKIAVGGGGMFYIVIYKAGSPDIFGTSVNTLVGA